MKKLLLAIVILLIASHGDATTYLSDHFDMDADTAITDGSQVTSEAVGNWVSVGSSQGNAVAISGAAGHSGRGLRFTWADGNGTTQEGNLGGIAEDAILITYPSSAWVGFWYRSSIAGGGVDGNDHLKMMRFYAGTHSIVPEWNMADAAGTAEFNMYWSQGTFNHLTGYNMADNNWHYYVFRFCGASTASGTDGIIEMYADNTLVYNNTAVNWGDANNTALDFRGIQGNLSGGWSGGVFTTDWDDFILADTQAEVETFLGVDSPDTSPDQFNLADQTGVALGSTDNSDNVTTAGYDNTTTLVLTGDASCKYSINGGDWATANDNITVGDNVALQNVASGSYSTAVSCTLNLGGVTDTWSRTTLAATAAAVPQRFRGGAMGGRK